MEFCFHTIYDHYTMTAMAKTMRKLFRRTQSLVIKALMFVMLCVGVYISTPLSGRDFSFTANGLISYLMLLLLALAIVWEDGINGFMALKRRPFDAKEASAFFTEEEYRIETENEVTRWQYNKVNYVAETKHFFVLIFNEKYGQIFDKDDFSGGTEEEFRAFLVRKTGKEIKRV